MVSNLLWSACDGFNGSVVVTFRSVVVGRPGAAGGVGRLGVDADRRSGHGALVSLSLLSLGLLSAAPLAWRRVNELARLTGSNLTLFLEHSQRLLEGVGRLFEIGIGMHRRGRAAGPRE